MRHVVMFVALALAGTVTWAPAALAQQEEASVETISLRADPRSYSEDWLILPAGSATVGGDLRFLMAEGGLGDETLRFTDVVLLDVHGRLSLRGSSELFTRITLLPKQPSRTGELLWQGASLGWRTGFGERFAASVQATVGPTLAHSGLWTTADVGVEARKSLHETFQFQGMLGASATALFLEETPGRRLGFGEIVANGEMLFRDPGDDGAVWIGTEFRFPIVRSSAPDLDPQTRVNFRLGTVLSYIRDWDLYAELVVNDRGDLNAPATRLPILNGGFDQVLLMLGVTRRFRQNTP